MAGRKLTTEEFERLVAGLPASVELAPAGPDTRFLGQLLSIGRRLLNELMSEQRFVAGEVILEEGDPGDSMYLIRSGHIAVVKGDWQAPVVLACLGPGDMVGEMALVDAKPRSASIVAVEEARLFKITRQSFRQLLKAEPDVGVRIMETLSSRLRVSDSERLTERTTGKQLARQLSALQREKLQWVELHRARQETSNLIVQDLRNLLSSIYGAVQMLQVVLPEETLSSSREILGIAVGACEGMQRLVNSLMDVARLEAGEIVLNPTETNLRHLVERAIGNTADSWETPQIIVHALVPGDLPPVIVDAQTVARVLVNLIDNALRYTPPKGTVLISAALESDHVVVSVNDSGPCLPPEERERIFDQVPLGAAASMPPERRGFGLELAFCRLVVEAHGGRIWLEPGDEGQGCRFVFSLPLESPLLPPP